MGFDKFRLPLGERTFLECVVDRLADSVQGPIVCAASAATKSKVNEIAERIGGDRLRVVADENPDCGPIEGIRCGLSAIADDVDWAFVTGCDVPLLKPEIIQVLIDAANESEVDAVSVSYTHLTLPTKA